MAVASPEPHRVGTPMYSARDSHRPERLSHAARLKLAVEIVAGYVQARRALRRAPIADVVAELRRRQPATTESTGVNPLWEAHRLGLAVNRLLAHLPGDTRCLARSLVLTRLLAGRGIEAKLVIGARSGPDFLAHAWVEHAGEPVLDPGDGFGRLVEL
jgi:hypothetical protein